LPAEKFLDRDVEVEIRVYDFHVDFFD